MEFAVWAVTSRAVRSYHPFHRYLIPLRGPSAVCSLLPGRGFPRALLAPTAHGAGLSSLHASPERTTTKRRLSGRFGAQYRGFASFVTLLLPFLSPERQQHISGCPINIVKSARKPPQRHDARESTPSKTASMPPMMHYPYIVRRAAGNANHWLMIFFAIRDANRRLPRNTLAINPPFSHHHQRTVVDMLLKGSVPAVTISIPLRNSAPKPLTPPHTACRACAGRHGDRHSAIFMMRHSERWNFCQLNNVLFGRAFLRPKIRDAPLSPIGRIRTSPSDTNRAV